jgi:phage gpG-like protein
MGSSGDYAAAHEFGYAPKGIPARPYLRPALQESRDDIKEDVSKELSSELQRAVRS